MVYFIHKLINPQIWFFLSIRELGLYIILGVLFGLLSVIILSIVRKSKSFKKRKWQNNFLFILAYFYSFAYITSLFLFVLSPNFENKLNNFLWKAILYTLLIILIFLVGYLLRFVFLAFMGIRRNKLILFTSSALMLILLFYFTKIYDINAHFFPKVPALYERNSSSRPNILWIFIDALRADYLSCYGNPKGLTPNMDKIAQVGVLYKNCISQAPWTLPSYGSFFTSTYPSQHGAEQKFTIPGKSSKKQVLVLNRELDYRNITIHKILKRYNYYTTVFQPNRFVSSKTGFNQGVDFFYNCFKSYTLLLVRLTNKILNIKVHSRWVYPDGEELTMYIINWVKKNKGKQFFLTVNYIDLHEYKAPHTYMEKIPKKYRNKKFSKEAYEMVLRFLDDQIGIFYNFLKEVDLLDNTVLIITSDHGEGFYEHGGREVVYYPDYLRGYGHQITLYDEIIWIPLIVRYPNKVSENLTINNQVRAIDLMPSLLSLVEAKIPKGIEGVDIFSSEIDNLIAFSESNRRGLDKKSLRTKEWKLIYTRKLEKFELYNLLKDPKEQNNLADKNEKILEELKQKLFSWMERMPQKITPTEKKELSQEEIEALKALGYLD
ncbi:MAG: sulfatase [Candidatus Aminicenantia bacterium]